MRHAKSHSSLTCLLPDRSRDVDPSAGLLWLLAVCTAVAAALWAGSDFAFEAKYTRSTFDDEVHLRPSSRPWLSTAPAHESTETMHARLKQAICPCNVAGGKAQKAGFQMCWRPQSQVRGVIAMSAVRHGCHEGLNCSADDCREQPGRLLEWRCRS